MNGSFLRVILFILSSCLISSLNADSNNEPSKQAVICNGDYVLCNAAACQQIPGVENRALCTCSVWQGKNIGFSSCEQRKAQSGTYKQTQLYSTFSFGGMHYKYMQCPAGKPWTSCLDQRCYVDKNHPRKAYCNCEIKSGTPYVTFAGMCDSKRCEDSMWSGAKVKDNIELMALLAKGTGLKTPVKVSCPIK